EQEVARFGDRTAGANVFLIAHDAAIDPAEPALGNAGTRDRGGLEAGLGHEARAEAVIDARRDQDVRCVDQLLELAALALHERLPGARRSCPMRSAMCGASHRRLHQLSTLWRSNPGGLLAVTASCVHEGGQCERADRLVAA